ncbi:S1 RNA binding domain protein [Clostridiales bacterium oral taxon 876 str. F0540]|nr:S1 RNA binding domain protein [Clostridiales bacterium oral taxon 876 str. F0540]
MNKKTEVITLKEVLIERNNKILRAAITENKKLIECLIEEESTEPQPGEIYKGIVKNIVPAIKCAFIDIGLGKNCYMYLDRKFNNTKLKKNDEVIVEVLKENIGDKGAKVTNAITVPGRYVVLEILNKEIAFSKKINDEGFKKYIRESINKPADVGLMIRTNAENVDFDTINNEIERLYTIYKDIMKSFKYSLGTKLLYKGEGILDKIIRDSFDEKVECIVVNDESDYSYLNDFLKQNNEINNCILKLYKDENMSLFSAYKVENQILALRDNKVKLPSGGYIVIDKTEAMYVVDVNSGKNTKNTSIDKTILDTNMEAAREIGHQIRLRNLSGIIIIDFIDMDNMLHKEKVLKEISDVLEGDKSKNIIYPFTELNLVQISRRRRGKPISEYIEDTCRGCRGLGSKLKLSYLSLLIRNEMLKLGKELSIENIYIELGSFYKDDIFHDIEGFADSIDCRDKKLYVNFVEHMDFFKLEALIFKNNIENLQKFKIYG